MTATLSDSVEAILDAILAAIQAEVDDVGSPLNLEGVASVVRGDRARPMPDLPSVWVVPQPATFEQQTYDEEAWSMPVSIAALVKDDDPAPGGMKAQRVAALARSAALAARDGIVGAEVTDIRSESFDPTARSSERNRTLYWTDATIRVTFTVTG